MKHLITASLLAICSAAQAEFWDGNKLLERMNGGQGDRAIALGYVIGAADATRGIAYCPPSPTITAGQVYDMVKIALEQAPSVRHLSGDVIVGAALGVTWPCSKGNSGGRQL
jgi:hypothetical protein